MVVEVPGNGFVHGWLARIFSRRWEEIANSLLPHAHGENNRTETWEGDFPVSFSKYYPHNPLDTVGSVSSRASLNNCC